MVPQSDFDRWWGGILEAADEELHRPPRLRGALPRLSTPQVLCISIIVLLA